MITQVTQSGPKIVVVLFFNVEELEILENTLSNLLRFLELDEIDSYKELSVSSNFNTLYNGYGIKRVFIQG